eukprot:7388807-Prymnesium_polylepis.1
MFTLAEFSMLVNTVRQDWTDGAVFAFFDDCLHQSELILGYETDAILLEAFVSCALEHELLVEPQKSFRLTPPDAAGTPAKSKRTSHGSGASAGSKMPVIGAAIDPNRLRSP